MNDESGVSIAEIDRAFAASASPLPRSLGTRGKTEHMYGLVYVHVYDNRMSLSSRAGGRVGKRGTSKAPLMSRFSRKPRGWRVPKIVTLFGAREFPRVPVPPASTHSFNC
jgi:hypothetical protein